MMKSIFDFPAIKEYLKSTKILVNSLHGGELKIYDDQDSPFAPLSF